MDGRKVSNSQEKWIISIFSIFKKLLGSVL
jgi:hypothetical protein